MVGKCAVCAKEMLPGWFSPCGLVLLCKVNSEEALKKTLEIKNKMDIFKVIFILALPGKRQQ